MHAPDERLRSAEGLLQEAVYASRSLQAARTAVAPPEPAADGGQCGLGHGAAVSLDLSDRGREHFRSLWPTDPAPADLERVRALLRTWIRDQDALDRRRNHFMKAFRAEHGFDRAAYAPETLAAWDEGLDRVNAEANDRRTAIARELLELAR